MLVYSLFSKDEDDMLMNLYIYTYFFIDTIK